MPYTVWSRGRLIGETDLAFMPVINVQRSGHFHPTVEGARVMDLIASPLPAMRAYLHRHACDADGNGLVLPELQGSALFADLAEAFHHTCALELELRREDGSVVPTEDIGFQDTHHLQALGKQVRDEAERAEDVDSWLENDPLEQSEADRQLEMDVQHDMELLDTGLDDWSDDVVPPWEPDDLVDETRFPRYQIHVTLVDENSIPCGRRLIGG